MCLVVRPHGFIFGGHELPRTPPFSMGPFPTCMFQLVPAWCFSPMDWDAQTFLAGRYGCLPTRAPSRFAVPEFSVLHKSHYRFLAACVISSNKFEVLRFDKVLECNRARFTSIELTREIAVSGLELILFWRTGPGGADASTEFTANLAARSVLATH